MALRVGDEAYGGASFFFLLSKRKSTLQMIYRHNAQKRVSTTHTQQSKTQKPDNGRPGPGRVQGEREGKASLKRGGGARGGGDSRPRMF